MKFGMEKLTKNGPPLGTSERVLDVCDTDLIYPDGNVLHSL